MRPLPHAQPVQRPPRQRQLGVTLIELMVTVTIGMFIVGSLGYVYLASTQVFRALEASSRVQENLRFAFERLGSDVRAAASLGCTAPTSTNVRDATSPLPWQYDLIDFPVRGYEDGVSTFPTAIDLAPSERLRGDALTLLYTDSATQGTIKSHVLGTTRRFDTDDAANFAVGDLVVAAQCLSHSAVFEVTSVTTAGSPSIGYGGTTNPPNCNAVTASICAASAGVSSSNLFTGGSLLRVSAYTYFIKNNSQGEPALYRLALRGGAIQTEEIVPGIEDMQIVYGVDTDATADSSVDEYVTADQVTSVAPGATVADQWRRVLAVRISLLAASYSGQEPNASQQTYRFNGADIVATDRKVRKVMTMTMAVRNRL